MISWSPDKNNKCWITIVEFFCLETIIISSPWFLLSWTLGGQWFSVGFSMIWSFEDGSYWLPAVFLIIWCAKKLPVSAAMRLDQTWHTVNVKPRGLSVLVIQPTDNYVTSIIIQSSEWSHIRINAERLLFDLEIIMKIKHPLL